jgi:hypothetical protein
VAQRLMIQRPEDLVERICDKAEHLATFPRVNGTMGSFDERIGRLPIWAHDQLATASMTSLGRRLMASR